MDFDATVFTTVQITDGAVGQATQPLIGQPNAALTVTYTCAPQGGNGFVTVSVDIDPYDTVEFSWYFCFDFFFF